jgi:hypothetical protein
MALKSLPLFLFAPLLMAGELKLTEDEKVLTFSKDGVEILTYHKAEVPPPEGADPVFRRSGFIHPLRSPKGGVVTGIHPADHKHHLGLWHAWVKTKHGPDTPDFWNLGSKSGRVRFSKVLEKTANGFLVEQEQVAYKGARQKEAVVLKEILKVTVTATDDANIIDYHLTQTNVSEAKLELPAYRYGGPLAYRGSASWDKKNSDYLTSEGKTRTDSHATRAHWCSMFGPTEKGVATVTMMGHPTNHDSPQRLRTWPDGKVFLCWTPVQEKGLEIEVGKSMTWKYRIIVSDGKADQGTITKWWETYRKK